MTHGPRPPAHSRSEVTRKSRTIAPRSAAAACRPTPTIPIPQMHRHRPGAIPVWHSPNTPKPVAAPACTPTPSTRRLPQPPGRAPTTATSPKRSIAPAHAAPSGDPAVGAYSGNFISPASSRNLDMLAPGMRRCGKAFQSDVPAASLITTPGVARDF